MAVGTVSTNYTRPDDQIDSYLYLVDLVRSALWGVTSRPPSTVWSTGEGGHPVLFLLEFPICAAKGGLFVLHCMRAEC